MATIEQSVPPSGSESLARTALQDEMERFVAAVRRGARPDPTIPGGEMDEKDVRNLELQIAASEERAQLRLENAMGRIEGQIGRIAEQIVAIRQETNAIRGDLSEQREDSRALRQELREDLAAARQELRGDIAAVLGEIRSSHKWTIGTVLATVITVGGAVMAVDIGLRQFWVAGVQTALAAHPPASG